MVRSTAAADRSTADFSQAFDMVVHGLLLCNLRNAQNYSVDAGMLVGSYLGERVQFVRSGGQESSAGDMTCGVSQGFVLGPLLFISYIDDRLEGYQVLPFSHSTDLSHLCCVGLSMLY
jgi:hypothetical protein